MCLYDQDHVNGRLWHAKMIIRAMLFPSSEICRVWWSCHLSCFWILVMWMSGKLHLVEQDSTMFNCLFRYVQKTRTSTENPHSLKVNWSLATDFTMARISSTDFNRTDCPNKWSKGNLAVSDLCKILQSAIKSKATNSEHYSKTINFLPKLKNTGHFDNRRIVSRGTTLEMVRNSIYLTSYCQRCNISNFYSCHLLISLTYYFYCIQSS